MALITISPIADGAEPTWDGWVSIFDGKSLEGWHGRPHTDPYRLAELESADREAQIARWTTEAEQHWRVDDGVLINDGAGPYLTTNEDYDDYELKLSYRTVPRADSGVYLKGCPQVQIWDYTDPKKFAIGADRGSGGLWNNPAGAAGKDPFILADEPFGSWNELHVIQVGSRTTVYLNEQLVVDHALMDNYWRRGEPLPVRGPIQLQTHGGEIAWRDIMVRPITPELANEMLASHHAQTFRPLFDGKTLEGWVGAVDDYEVSPEGTIRCRKGRGGNLLTAEEFENFEARLEFLLPPGGNNGLAIRSPLDVNPAYGAMCELQVIDTDHPKYAKIDARQVHGSAYGMVGARRGYLRPTGQWNFQEVRVDASRVRIELNGNVILDADLASVSEFMGGMDHPGLQRTRGHFGFAGHSDPVEFRNVAVRELPGPSREVKKPKG